MKTWLRFLLGAALLCTAAAGARAQTLSATGITASPGSAKPNDRVTFTVGVSNSDVAAAFPAGGTVTAAITLRHLTTGYSFTINGTGRATAQVAAATPGDGTNPSSPGAGSLEVVVTVPTGTTEAGGYSASITISAPSAGTIASSSFSVSTSVLTVTGTPDLQITSLTYTANPNYVGGDVIPMTLTYRNKTFSSGTPNVPWVASNTAALYFRIQVVLSSNPTYGDADDFRLTFHDRGTKLDADDVDRTITWNQLLPGNFSGSYYVLAKIDALDGTAETVENNLIENGNNIWSDVAATRIALQPTTFPTIYLASRTAGGNSGAGYSDNPSLTADGRYTAYASDATDLVTGDTNGVRDIFLFDSQTSLVRRLNLSQQGAQANGNSNTPALSGNGRYVAFSSDATNLIVGDVNGFADIFIVDTLTGTISMQSVSAAGAQANGSSFRPSVSQTGRYLVFESSATNLVGTTAVGVTHIYLRDRDVSGSGVFDTPGNTSIVLVDVNGAAAGNANATQAQISADGRYVAFSSRATNLAAAATTAGRQHVYVRDVVGGTTTLASVGTGGTEANADSRNPYLNRNAGVSSGVGADGRYIAFASDAANLVASDSNGVSDVFVFDRTSGSTTRVSVSATGAQAVDPTATTLTGSRLGSLNPSISATGRYVTFASLADNLAPGDSVGQYVPGGSGNGALNVYVVDRDRTATGAYDTAGNLHVSNVSVNRFGYQAIRILSVQSTAAADIFPVISADGRWVAFPFDSESSSGLIHTTTNLISPDGNSARDVALFDRRTNALPTASSPPVVTITSPGNGGSALVNTAINVTASATTTVGVVSSVQFFVNGTSLGSDLAFPYAATWTPVAVGSYTLSALVTDSFGNIGVSSNIVVTINAAPSVGISSPVAGAKLVAGAAQTITAAAAATTPGASIASVQFLVNGGVLGAADTTAPYSASWTPNAVGTYELSAIATDSLGTQTTSPVVSVTVAGLSSGVVPPVVAVTGPAAGSAVIVNTPQTLSANASSANSTIASVAFFANGAAVGAADTIFPYAAAWTPTALGSYSIVARATDANGNVTDSTPVVVTVSASAPPVVALTTPVAGATYVLGAVVDIAANATDTDGTIASVQFFANGTAIGTADTTFPYSASWAPTAPGTYSLTARATDSGGSVADTSPLVVTVALSVAPVVSVTSPAAGASFAVGSSVTVRANASDSDGTIASVQFFANGASLGGADTVFPYTAVWTPTALGNYSITARATDVTGSVTDSAPVVVSVTASASPVVALTGPTAGAAYPLGVAVNLGANASDPDGIVTSVQYFANGVSLGAPAVAAPFAFTWRPPAVGTFAVTAVATDNVGNTATSPAVSVSIVAAGVPAVSISNPLGGARLPVGTAIPFVVQASGGNGGIAQVQFFVNGAPLGADAVPPYSATWTPTIAGTYSLVATATDSAGVSSNSSTVTVQIEANAPPTVALTSPAAGSSVIVGNSVNLTVNANDSDGTVASVRYLVDGATVATAATAPFAAVWAPTAAGTFSVVAQAVDNSGNVANSAARTVTVVANRLPVVALVSPGNGSTVRIGAGATLTATASDPDGTLVGVQFFANGTALAADTTPPYTTTFTPTAEGIYLLTAIATDNAGGSVTSSVVTVRALVGGSGDSVYAGSYSGIGESGRFAVVSAGGRTAAFIGYATSGATRTYFYPGMTVDVSGGFAAVDGSGRSLVSGSVSDTGAAGTIDAGRLTFIGPVAFPSSTATVAAGYYTGNLTGRFGSTVAVIVGADGSITAYVADGAFADAGSGMVAASGAFTLGLTGGGTLAGTVNPATGFLTGTLTGGPGGAFTAALASGVSFSDGFLRNLSTRGQVGTGANLLIAGFTVAGNTPKRVLIRGIGPSLTQFGVAGVLADPALELYSGSARVGANDNWGGDTALATASAEAGAFPIAAASRDAALLTTLSPGSYTVQVSGVGATSGVALVELYDLDNLSPFSAQKVMNVATRGVVGTGQAQLIAGFAVSGNTAKKVLVRGIGPSLATVGLTAGLLADPVLTIVRSDGTAVRENDNWETGNDAKLVANAAASVQAFPLAAGSRDAAILVTLPPGTYTAQVTGTGTSTGIALVEVYELP